MDRVLAAIDFSGDSINALEHAINYANVLNCHLRLVFVNKKKEFETPSYFQEEEFVNCKSPEEYFDLILNKFKDRYIVEKGVFDYKALKGKVYVEINNLAKKDNSIMIVMGTHGISGFEEYFLGSNAFRVVSKAPCPVVTIRHGFGSGNLRKIVLPIDVTNQSRQKVPLVLELAYSFDAEVHVLGVHETDGAEVISRINQYKDQVYDHLISKGLKAVKEIMHGGNITKMTIDYAKNIDADLIAIMTEQTERPENLWLGPYAQQMVNHSPIPVLCIHPNPSR